MTASSWLALAALAAFSSAALVARFSRWRWLSPWCTPCVMAGAALVVASGAEDGHWIACAAGVAVAVMQGKVAVRAARARCRITAALAGEAEARRG